MGVEDHGESFPWTSPSNRSLPVTCHLLIFYLVCNSFSSSLSFYLLDLSLFLLSHSILINSSFLYFYSFFNCRRRKVGTWVGRKKRQNTPFCISLFIYFFKGVFVFPLFGRTVLLPSVGSGPEHPYPTAFHFTPPTPFAFSQIYVTVCTMAMVLLYRLQKHRTYLHENLAGTNILMFNISDLY